MSAIRAMLWIDDRSCPLEELRKSVVSNFIEYASEFDLMKLVTDISNPKSDVSKKNIVDHIRNNYEYTQERKRRDLMVAGNIYRIVLLVSHAIHQPWEINIFLSDMKFGTAEAASIAGKVAVEGDNSSYYGYFVVVEKDLPILGKHVLEKLQAKERANEIIE